MSLYSELKTLLSPNIPQRRRGVVIESGNSFINVLVNGKSRRLTRLESDSTTYKNGDSVFVQGDVLIGRARVQKSKVYYL